MLTGFGLVAALAIAGGLSPLVGTQSPWEMRHASSVRRTGTFAHPLLDESSGVAVSRRQPGVLWTMNDSGNDSWIFATDTMGRDHGALAVADARNRDWEAIALGPCGTKECLYLADTGDNGLGRRTASLYRLPEPTVHARGGRTARAEVLEFRYPKGSPDVEAAFVAPDGAVYLISKGRGSPPRLYRLPAKAWEDREVATAESLGKVPIEAGSLANRVTDAALSPSGNRVAVRTYVAVYLFELTPGGDLVPSGVACEAAGLQLQGEGISWLDDRVLVLTSEGGFGSPGSIILLECGDSR